VLVEAAGGGGALRNLLKLDTGDRAAMVELGKVEKSKGMTIQICHKRSPLDSLRSAKFGPAATRLLRRNTRLGPMTTYF